MPQIKELPNSGMTIPDEAINRLADAMLPLMQAYFESDEGKAALEMWRRGAKKDEAVPA